MRFMMLMYPSEKAETGVLPDPELFAAMRKYNEELSKAGVLLALDGLQPSAKGARITWDAAGKPTVTDGPFTEVKEVIGGYWMVQVKSREEAIEWAKRVPPHDARKVELRQVFEMTDFPADVQKAAHSPEVRATIERIEKHARS
ncbi:MAG TPA: YciI family protein [Polyangia bacterium]|nr:YciI family protein [Polyangia bacterium]